MTVSVVLEGELPPVPLRQPFQEDQGRVIGETAALMLEDRAVEAS
jgi:hypothetical protein